MQGVQRYSSDELCPEPRRAPQESQCIGRQCEAARNLTVLSNLILLAKA
jgi:hypothetical protein